MKTWDEYPRPSVAVDVAALTVVPGERKDEPWLGLLVHRRPEGTAYWDEWDIPGGFLQERESLSHAVRRVLRDKCQVTDLANAQGQEPHQLHVFDNPGRDPRGWVVSVAHMIAVPFTRLPPALIYGDDPRVRLARVVPVDELEEDHVAADMSLTEALDLELELEASASASFPALLSLAAAEDEPAALFELEEAELNDDEDLHYASGSRYTADALERRRLWLERAARPSSQAYQSTRPLSRRLRQRSAPSPSAMSARRVSELISREERQSDHARPIGLELDGWDLELPWDHNAMVGMAVRTLQKSYLLNPDPERLLVTGSIPDGDLLEPPSFTLTELRQVHEAVLGRPIQRDNFSRMFRKKLEPAGSTAGRGAVGRPASTFSHRDDDDLEAY